MWPIVAKLDPKRAHRGPIEAHPVTDRVSAASLGRGARDHCAPCCCRSAGTPPSSCSAIGGCQVILVVLALPRRGRGSAPRRPSQFFCSLFVLDLLYPH